MKLIWLSVVILCLALAQNISAEKTVSCDVLFWKPSSCIFYHETIEANEAVRVEIGPRDAPFVDVNAITRAQFTLSSIYSLPQEIFTKIPNLKSFYTPDQKIQEIKQDTFKDAKKLEWICLSRNALTFLHQDTFKGMEFSIR
jgi:hypothetical protein